MLLLWLHVLARGRKKRVLIREDKKGSGEHNCVKSKLRSHGKTSINALLKTLLADFERLTADKNEPA